MASQKIQSQVRMFFHTDHGGNCASIFYAFIQRSIAATKLSKSL